MRTEFDWLVLLLLAVRRMNQKRLCHFVFKHGRQIVINKSLSSDNRHSAAVSCNGISRKRRAFALYNICNLNFKSECAFVNECERKIPFAVFQRFILFERNIRLVRHLLSAVAENVSKLLNSRRNFL